MSFLDRLEHNQAIGLFRQKIVADILDYIHRQEPAVSVYTLYNNYSLLDKSKGSGTRGDKFYVFREGYTIVVRPLKKAPDILVYKDGKLKSAWEITNYGTMKNGEHCFMKHKRLYRYVKNLSKFDCDRILLVSYSDTFRKLRPNKTPEQNIEWTEKFLAEKGIFVFYLGWYDALPEEKEQGWIK